jgi:hypothetical protein
MSSAPVSVRAACGSETKYRINLADAFWKDYTAYNDEANEDMATASLKNMRHQLDIIKDNDMENCASRTIKMAYNRAEAKNAFGYLVNHLNVDQALSLEIFHDSVILAIHYGLKAADRTTYDYLLMALKGLGIPVKNIDEEAKNGNFDD